MTDPQAPAALTAEDYAHLYQMSLSSDSGQRDQAATLAKKLTPAESQAFFDFQKTQTAGTGERTREDATVGGLPPELAITGGIGVARAAASGAAAMGGPLLGRVVAGAKSAFSSVGTPVLKYEATKALLKHVGVSDSLATVGAMAVAGYSPKGGAVAAPVATADAAAPAVAAAAVAPAADEALVDVSAPTPAAGMGRSAFNDAMAQAMKKAKGPVADAAAPTVAPAAAAPAPVADPPVARPVAPVLGKDVMAVKAAAAANKVKLTSTESAQALKWLGQGVPAEKVWERIAASRELSASDTFSPMDALKKAIDVKDNRKITGRYLP